MAEAFTADITPQARPARRALRPWLRAGQTLAAWLDSLEDDPPPGEDMLPMTAPHAKAMRHTADVFELGVHSETLGLIAHVRHRHAVPPGATRAPTHRPRNRQQDTKLELRWRDPRTGEDLRTLAEHNDARERAEQERERAERERDESERRNRELEALVRSLRESG